MWDLIETSVQSIDFKKITDEVVHDFEEYKKHPFLHIWKGLRWVLGGATLFLLLLSLPSTDDEIFGIIKSIVGFVVIVIILIGFSMITSGSEIKKLMTKILFAQKNKLVYNPEPSFDRLMKLAEFFSILQKDEIDEDSDDSVSDQFWGVNEVNGKKLDFYMSLYSYHVGDGKARKYFTNTIMIMPLQKKIAYPFIVREGVRKRSDKNNIELESIEFNERFIVNFVDKKTTVATEIIKILTPALQQKFIEVADKYGYFTVEFSNNAVLFSISGDKINVFRTSAFGEIKIKAQDEKKIHDNMNAFFGVAAEIIKYVD